MTGKKVARKRRNKKGIVNRKKGRKIVRIKEKEILYIKERKKRKKE